MYLYSYIPLESFVEEPERLGDLCTGKGPSDVKSVTQTVFPYITGKVVVLKKIPSDFSPNLLWSTKEQICKSLNQMRNFLFSIGTVSLIVLLSVSCRSYDPLCTRLCLEMGSDRRSQMCTTTFGTGVKGFGRVWKRTITRIVLRSNNRHCYSTEETKTFCGVCSCPILITGVKKILCVRFVVPKYRNSRVRHGECPPCYRLT